MTPAKLKRKTKNKLLSYAKAMDQVFRGLADPDDGLDHLHDFAMRCYSEGFTHGEAAGREKEESKDA